MPTRSFPEPIRFPAPARRLVLALGLIACVLLAGCSNAAFIVANLDVDAAAIASVPYDPAHGLSLVVHRPPPASAKVPVAHRPPPASAKVPVVHRPPPASAKVPVVVFIHGGSWRNGSRRDYRFVGQSLARAGFVVIVPDYRKVPQVAFPDFVEDAARAVAWAKQHAAEYGGDPSRIYLMGHSSGAHVAALLGTDAHFLRAVGMRPRDLAGVVGLSGPYDFLPITDPANREVFGPEPGWPASQPVNFVDGDEPPFLLLQGTADTLVRPGNAPSLADKLRRAGEPVELRMLDGTSHAGTLTGLVRDGSPVRRIVLDYLAGTPPLSAAAARPR